VFESRIIQNIYQNRVKQAFIDDTIKRFRFKIHVSYIHLHIYNKNNNLIISTNKPILQILPSNQIFTLEIRSFIFIFLLHELGHNRGNINIRDVLVTFIEHLFAEFRTPWTYIQYPRLWSD